MYLLFDIGATNLRIAVSKSGTKIDRSIRVKTPEKFADGMSLIKALSYDILRGAKPKMVVGGVASPLQGKNFKLVEFNHPDWTNKQLLPHLSKIFSCPFEFENDAALGALGEAKFGSGKKHKIVAFVTISTGIGGARIVNGKIDINASGFEPRLQMLKSNPLKNFGSLSSGHAIHKIYNQPGELLMDKKAWKEIELWLTMGLNNIIVLWSPEVLVVGGPVAKNKNISFERIEKQLKKNLKILKKLPKIKKAKLGQLSVLYGALTLLRK